MLANTSLREESSSDSQAQSINLDDLEGEVTGNRNGLLNDNNSPPEISPVSTPPASITDPEDRRISRSWCLWLMLTGEIVLVVLSFAWARLYYSVKIKHIEAGIYEPDKPVVTVVIGVAHFFQFVMSLVMFIIICFANDKPLIIFLRVYLVFCCIILATFGLVVLGSIIFTTDIEGFDMWQRHLLNIINMILRIPMIMCVHDLLEEFEKAVPAPVSYELRRLSEQQAPQIPLLRAEESQAQDGTMESSV